jgi:hypothetical protein
LKLVVELFDDEILWITPVVPAQPNKDIVDELGDKVPALATLPYTLNALLPLIVNTAPEEIDKSYTSADAAIDGVPEGIAAIKSRDGTPALQLPELLQTLSTAPVQVVVGAVIAKEIELEFAVADVTHVAFEVNTQVIASPTAKPEPVNVELFVPTLPPFFFHWYDGEAPPLVIDAENAAPVHNDVDVFEMLIVGVTVVVTAIVTVPLVAVAVVWQVLFAVITQVTASAFAKVVEVNVADAEFCTDAPFTLKL